MCHCLSRKIFSHPPTSSNQYVFILCTMCCFSVRIALHLQSCFYLLMEYRYTLAFNCLVSLQYLHLEHILYAIIYVILLHLSMGMHILSWNINSTSCLYYLLHTTWHILVSVGICMLFYSNISHHIFLCSCSKKLWLIECTFHTTKLIWLV